MAWSKRRNKGGWTGIVLIGDDGVGRHTFAQNYIHPQSSLSAGEDGPNQQHITRMNVQLGSTRIPHPQLKLLDIKTNKQDHEALEIGFFMYSPNTWDIQSPLHGKRVMQVFFESHVIAICYDFSRPETLHNAIYKWYPMMLYHGTNVPVVLVGCRSDLKHKDPSHASTPLVTTEKVKKAARQIGAMDALEYSAQDKESVKNTGDLLVWYACYSHFGKAQASSTLWGRLQAFLR